MAIILGEVNYKDMMPAERAVYDFVAEKMPDYVCAVFNLVLEGREYDALVMVPHMGVFVLEISSASSLTPEPGRMRGGFHPNLNRARDAKYHLLNWFRKRFYLTPMVYDIMCFPKLILTPEEAARIRQTGVPDLNHVLLASDLQNSYTFFGKLGSFFIDSALQLQQRYPDEMRQYDDLSDELVQLICERWNVGIQPLARPSNPPMVFMSYNRQNQYRALLLKVHLEKRGIYTWRAPEDVPLNAYYLTMEMEAIRYCDIFLLLLSESSQKSEEVRKEVEAALAAGKPIYAIRLGEFEVNAYYSDVLKKSQYRTIDADKREELGIRPPSENETQVLDELVKLIKKGAGEA